MAVDMFLKSKIAGESRDDKHKGEIDVLAWSWGASQAGTFHQGGGGGAGKVSINDLSVTKFVDLASTQLLLHCCNGEHIPEMILTVRKASGKVPLEYMIITMTKCMITSFSTGGSGGEDRLTENVTINFAKAEVEYTEQKGDGNKGDVKRFSWDIEKNVE